MHAIRYFLPEAICVNCIQDQKLPYLFDICVIVYYDDSNYYNLNITINDRIIKLLLTYVF